MVHHLAVDGVAEIVAATPDGMTLVYTSADAGVLGLIDITRPEQPVLLPRVDVMRMGVGEPTSVAISSDGRYAVAAVRMGDDESNARQGFLRVYDIRNPRAVQHVKDITVGVGPDSLALVGQGRTLRAVVAIEDEETDAKGDATLGGQRPGRIDVVGLQDLYGGASTGVQSIELVKALQATAGVVYPNDPQPEFVSIDARTQKAVVSLQENNAVAILDLSQPARARLERVFSTGSVVRNGNADLQKDKEVLLKDSFTGRREADAVAWVAPGVFATANEGDGKKDKEGVLPGARGFTLMNIRGEVVYEAGERTELNALLYGHYPDGRSASKGVEIEGVAAGTFGGKPYLFAGSERGSFVEVHRVDDPKQPRFVQLLPTGMSPEGLTTVTKRRDGQQLLITANEGEGSLNLYRFHAQGAPAAREPQLVAKDHSMPWGALSGLTTDGTHLYAVPDNAFGQSRIYRIDPSQVPQGRMVIDQVTMLTTADGQALKVDPEGIARVADGFWIASEGATVEGNELIKVNATGVVQQRVKLPASVQARFVSPKTGTGYEGVTASADGQTLYMAIQRGFDVKRPQAAILKLHLPTDTWTTAFYPLDQHSKDPQQFWMGLSEIQLTDDGRLLLLERDKGGGEGQAINAEVKRVYSVKATDITEGATLQKTLVKDLRKDFNYLQEKAEGMAVFKGDLWVVNDNDGAGWTRWVNAGKP
ncbi:hypothetical protein B0E41_14560 [Hydrogenophaga sp. A37]|nr:hypothetical protein B0E41_14560 [Hydrogenophaga sp. A37]